MKVLIFHRIISFLPNGKGKISFERRLGANIQKGVRRNAVRRKCNSRKY